MCPCNCDYLEASSFEKECQRMAKLIIYVESFYKGVTPKWIKECAKNEYGAPNGQQDGDERLGPYLCKLLTNLKNGKNRQGFYNQIVYNAKNKQSRDLADWWEEHQEKDKERTRFERSEKLKRETIKKALGKLTKEEKEILGLKD